MGFIRLSLVVEHADGTIDKIKPGEAEVFWIRHSEMCSGVACIVNKKKTKIIISASTIEAYFRENSFYQVQNARRTDHYLSLRQRNTVYGLCKVVSTNSRIY